MVWKCVSRVLAAAVLGALCAPSAALAQAAPPPASAPPAAAQDPPPASPAQDPSPAPQQAMPPGGGRVFNPDMSVIANFLGNFGKNPMTAEPLFKLSEVETSFQAAVDPYARADFFLSASPEGLEVEEGYITFTHLPAGLLLKGGKMRAQFGKVNTQHTHALPYADRPLVTDNLVGGEEGISQAGLSLSKLFATEALFVEATGEVYGGSSDVFQTVGRKPTVVGRVRGYRDLTEGTNLDFGVSTAVGPSDSVESGSSKTLVGIDATFRYRPLRRAIYRRFQARTELIWSRQDAGRQTVLASDQHAFGWYGLAEYQFAQRWYSGVRIDRSQRALDGSLTDTGQSAFLTFWPSEFSQIRGQYRHTKYAEGVAGHEVLFQMNFSIGAHGAHVF